MFLAVSLIQTYIIESGNKKLDKDTQYQCCQMASLGPLFKFLFFSTDQIPQMLFNPNHDGGYILTYDGGVGKYDL